MSVRSIVLLALAALGGASVPLLASGASERAPAVGRIEGRLEVRERPARRVPRRYPGGPAASARPVQPIPAVVYLEGDIPGPAAGGRAVIAQRDTAFVPSVLVISVGGEVAFPNEDPFFHNVFSYSPAQRFDLGRYPQGESKSVRFDRAGVVKIYCEVHESMRSAVLVTENPYHARVADDGSFSIPGVPAGAYTLVAWHVDLGETRRAVRVPDGGTVRVDLTIE